MRARSNASITASEMFSIGRIQNSHRFFNRYILIAISISMILLSGPMEREGEGSSNVVRTFMSAGMAGAGGVKSKAGDAT